MIVMDWHEKVNKKISIDGNYSQEDGFVEEVRFDSGKQRIWQKNSYIPMVFSDLSLLLNNKEIIEHGKTEKELFDNWYKVTLRNGTLPFYFSNILNPAETAVYQFTPQSVTYDRSEGIVQASFGFREVSQMDGEIQSNLWVTLQDQEASDQLPHSGKVNHILQQIRNILKWLKEKLFSHNHDGVNSSKVSYNDLIDTDDIENNINTLEQALELETEYRIQGDINTLDTANEYTNIEVKRLDSRINSVENLGNYAGAFDSFALLPTDKSFFVNGITVNDFATIRNDETMNNKTTRYIVTNITNGLITWIYDLTYTTDISGKADKLQDGVTDNFISIAADGNIKDSGVNENDIIAQIQEGSRGTLFFMVRQSLAIPAENMRINDFICNAGNDSIIVGNLSMIIGDVVEITSLIPFTLKYTGNIRGAKGADGSIGVNGFSIRADPGSTQTSAQLTALGWKAGDMVLLGSSARTLGGVNLSAYTMYKIVTLPASGTASFSSMGSFRGIQGDPGFTISTTTSDPGIGSSLATNTLLLVYQA